MGQYDTGIFPGSLKEILVAKRNSYLIWAYKHILTSLHIWNLQLNDEWAQTEVSLKSWQASASASNFVHFIFQSNKDLELTGWMWAQEADVKYFLPHIRQFINSIVPVSQLMWILYEFMSVGCDAMLILNIFWLIVLHWKVTRSRIPYQMCKANNT